MSTLNLQFDQLRQSATVAVADRIAALKAEGRKIIGLQMGDPDFPTPPAVMDVALKAMHAGFTHYVPSRGLSELRQAVATKLERDNGAVFDPTTEILVTHGSIHAYYIAMQAILNPGDEVLVPDPTWATHANMVVMLKGKAIRVPAPASNGFLPEFQDWERAITKKTRAIVINYPSNPTGAYPDHAYLQRLVNLAVAHDLWIVSDEVYENLYYEKERPTSAASLDGARDRVLLVNSLSKTYAMTGWRVGYLAAPSSVIDHALKASQNSITCVAPFIQKAAAFALTDPEIQIAASNMRAEYSRRRQLVLDLAQEFGKTQVIVVPPSGAFYFFLDMRAFNIPSVEICEDLLDQAQVGLVPGSAFGKQGEGFVRMTIAAAEEEIKSGFWAILQWADGFVKKR